MYAWRNQSAVQLQLVELLLSQFVSLRLARQSYLSIFLVPVPQLLYIQMQIHLFETALSIVLQNRVHFVTLLAKRQLSRFSFGPSCFQYLGKDLSSPVIPFFFFVMLIRLLLPVGQNAIVMIATFALQERQLNGKSLLLSHFSDQMIDLMIVFLPTLLQLMQAAFQFLFIMVFLFVARSGKLVPFGLSRKQVFERVRVGLVLILLSHIMQKCDFISRYCNNNNLMASTCLVCCEESECWVLPPCNHREVCWKCCLKLVDGSIFSCPFCKDRPQAKSQLLFVTTAEMQSGDYQAIMRSNPFRSNKNSFYYYSCAAVAEYIEAETSFHCVVCGEVHQSLNLLRKHLNSIHRVQFCDVCLDNRRCITGEQRLFSDGQLQVHLKQGDLSESGEVLLYHPFCQFCARRFYDLDAFRLHLRMSSHLKCEVCDLNAPKLKYVYYKGYEDLQRHHKKTHHVCDVGDCVGKKLENVFASEALLEEHKRRCHRKHRNDKPQEKVENILLGFNQQAEQDFIEFDGIGRNLEKEFAIFERTERVDKQQHNDELIDIRQFYPQIIRNSAHCRLQQLFDTLEHLHHRFGQHTRQVRFSDVPLFKPLQMAPLSRVQCERLLKRCCGREADAIIDIFFTKRHEFSNGNDYFTAIQRRMKTVSIFAFFIAFPQLVRFMKDENRNKIPMDQHYALRLRTLTVGKQLLCHAFDRYSQLLEFLRNQVREQVRDRCESGALQIDKYCKYLRQMSTNYYVQNQEDLYYVPREKATNLYHMIDRCRTKDFLKLNWLLKVGLPQSQYSLLLKSLHFKTKQECNGLFNVFRTKELALLNLYFSICLEALLDQQTFDNSKRNPRPHYLSDFIATIPRPKTISAKLLDEIRSLEGHSSAIERKTRERTGRAIVVDEGDCPSLLQAETDPAPRRKPPEEPELGIGKARLRIWNEEEALRRKKATVKPQEPSHDEEFPVLFGQAAAKKKEQTAKVSKQEAPEQDFPVFNFKEKYVTPKQPRHIEQPQVKIQHFLGFNNKTVTTKWDQTRTRERFDQINREKEREQMEKAQKKNKKQETPKEKSKKNRMPNDDEDEYLKMAIKQSLITAQQQERERERESKPQEVKGEIIIPKKNKKEDQQPPKKNKKKPNQEEQKQVKKQVKNEDFLFQAIEREAQLRPKKEKGFKMRIDYSDSEEQQPKKPEIKPARQQIKAQRQEAINADEFMPIGGGGGESIITKLQKEAAVQQVQNTKVIKNGRKGKKVVIERVNIF